jgi:predicted nucleic-acid-binding protein
MRAIDTNILVRLITRDHPRQHKAALQAINNGAWVSLVTLVETVWVLKSSFGLSRDRLADTIGVLLKHDALLLQDAEVVESALTLYSGSPRIEFSDCVILAQARRAGHGPLMTFDRDLARLDGAQRLEA